MVCITFLLMFKADYKIELYCMSVSYENERQTSLIWVTLCDAVLTDFITFVIADPGP